MEKDIGKIQKNEGTEIVVRIDDFGGRKGVTIREFITGERYTGFTKAGTRIPVEKFTEFKELINSIDPEDLKVENEATGEIEQEKNIKTRKASKKKVEETSESKRTGLASEEEIEEDEE